MRIECESCGAWVSPPGAEVLGAIVRLPCPACGAASELPVAPRADRGGTQSEEAPGKEVSEGSVDASAQPPAGAAASAASIASGRQRAPGAAAGAAESAEMAAMECPKCGTAQGPASACRRCGLLAEHFSSFSAREGAGANPTLRRAWEACLEDWDDADAHEAFLERAVELSGYAYAARRYRGRLRERPGDATAARQLERVRRMAEAAALSVSAAGRRRERGPEYYRGAILVLVVLAFLAAAGVVYAIFAQGGQPLPGGGSEPESPGIEREELPGSEPVWRGPDPEPG